jgi:hypothetical protein
MPSTSRATKKAKKPYVSPFLVVLDPAVAKEKLKGKGDPKDEKVKKMLEFIPDRPKS